MEFHELADIFPIMSMGEFAALKTDIAKHGLMEPITLAEGKIADGRNRYLACQELGIEPRYEQWNGQGSLLAFIVSKNLQRRHLGESQRAMVAAKIANMEREDTLRQFATDASFEASVSQSDAAAMMNTSRSNVQRAKKVLTEGSPKLARAVEQDKVAVSLAAKATELPEEKQVKMVDLVGQGVKPKEAYRQVTRPEPMEFNLSGKYRIFYADPPWQYGNSGVINDDNYGRAERHYPTMTIDELCTLPIKDMAEDNAVLFLWTTSPILEDSFEVIKAWGFEYKTSFVWDKVRHNFGHYNSVRHEFLLICTRGSCTPDSDRKFDSVVICERTDRHSEKPEVFRGMIEALYTWGARVELFARSQHEGWESWGNEV